MKSSLIKILLLYYILYCTSSGSDSATRFLGISWYRVLLPAWWHGARAQSALTLTLTQQLTCRLFCTFCRWLQDCVFYLFFFFLTESASIYAAGIEIGTIIEATNKCKTSSDINQTSCLTFRIKSSKEEVMLVKKGSRARAILQCHYGRAASCTEDIHTEDGSSLTPSTKPTWTKAQHSVWKRHMSLSNSTFAIFLLLS